ncbi:MAG: dUTP diphosphatase [Eubacteriaceae bacterium]|nr:dUTP diphosphatase [Eubacteriaceae bacterium]
MNDVIVKIVNKSGNPLPQYATEDAAGMDIFANEDMLLENCKVSLVGTGLYIELPKGYEAQIRCRSGLALKHGVMLVNGIGTIDADYRGEIKIIMTTISNTPYQIKKGDRIAQMVICKLTQAQLSQVAELDVTQRNEGGFGSSGV